MAFEISQTSTEPFLPFVLVHGPAKIGKTRLIPTCPQPFVIDTDQGISAIRDKEQFGDIPFVKVREPEVIEEVLTWIEAGNLKGKAQTIYLDDLTECGEMWLRKHKPEYKDGRKAFGVMSDWIWPIIYRLRALSEQGYFVVMNCKQERVKDERTGAMLWGPMFPGRQVTNNLEFAVGEIYSLEFWEGQDANGQQIKSRVFRTERDNQYAAGSRFGKLAPIEFADFNGIFQKMIQG